jgi:hypothetical protein
VSSHVDGYEHEGAAGLFTLVLFVMLEQVHKLPKGGSEEPHIVPVAVVDSQMSNQSVLILQSKKFTEALVVKQQPSKHAMSAPPIPAGTISTGMFMLDKFSDQRTTFGKFSDLLIIDKLSDQWCVCLYISILVDKLH